MMETGINFIQLRSKSLSAERLRVEAQAAGKAAEERGAVLVVNDCPSLAADSRASGVHLGMEDGSPWRARELLGESAIIGRTVHSLAEARQVKDEGNCDYVGLGPYRTSQTKRSLDAILGHAEIVEIRSFLDPLPIYLIGGLGLSDIGLIEELGVNGLAVCSALSDGEVFGANLEAFVERANAFIPVGAVS